MRNAGGYDPSLIKNRLVDNLLILISIFGSFAIVASISRMGIAGFRPLMAFHIAAYIVVVLMTARRQFASVRLKFGFLMITYLLLGVGSLLTWGLLGFGIPFLLMAVLVATTGFGFKSGMLIATLSVGAIIVIGVGTIYHFFPCTFDAAVYASAISSWVTALMSFMFFGIVAILIMGYFNEVLHQEFLLIREQKTVLEQTNMILGAEIENRKIAELQIKRLRGLLPICAGCKKIRDENGEWKALERYIQKHSDATFSHGLCPECLKMLYPGVDLSEN